jgi:hypothetical protein
MPRPSLRSIYPMPADIISRVRFVSDHRPLEFHPLTRANLRCRSGRWPLRRPRGMLRYLMVPESRGRFREQGKGRGGLKVMHVFACPSPQEVSRTLFILAGTTASCGCGVSLYAQRSAIGPGASGACGRRCCCLPLQRCSQWRSW